MAITSMTSGSLSLQRMNSDTTRNNQEATRISRVRVASFVCAGGCDRQRRGNPGGYPPGKKDSALQGPGSGTGIAPKRTVGGLGRRP